MSRIQKKYRWAEFFLPALALMVFAAILIPMTDHSPWESFATWRQSDTYSIALNFENNHTDIFHAELNYDGTGDNYAQLELQIIPYLSAKIFRILGYETPVVPRCLSLIFFLGSAWFLFLLLKRFVSLFSAFCGICVYLSIPLSVLISRSIQPESCALFFYLGGIYFIRLFQETKTKKDALLASIMIVLAIIEKAPAAFAGILYIYVFLSSYGLKAFRMWLTYLCIAVSLGPWILFTVYTSHISTFRFVDGIASKHILTGELFSFFEKATQNFFQDAFSEYFGWVLIVVSIIGLLLCIPKKRRFVLVWGLAFIFETVTIVSVVKFAYYLIFLLPICAVLSSFVLEFFFRMWKPSAVLAFVILLGVLFLADQNVWKEMEVHQGIEKTGEFIRLNTDYQDGIAVLAGTDPSYINAAERKGYRANIDYYDEIPSDPQGETDYYRNHGIRWFVVITEELQGSNIEYADYLQNHYPELTHSKTCIIYDLQRQNGE